MLSEEFVPLVHVNLLSHKRLAIWLVFNMHYIITHQKSLTFLAD